MYVTCISAGVLRLHESASSYDPAVGLWLGTYMYGTALTRTEGHTIQGHTLDTPMRTLNVSRPHTDCFSCVTLKQRPHTDCFPCVTLKQRKNGF